MAKHLVLVAGNIGAGKTSLTERLAARLNWSADYESVADNPYLSDFYADMRTWAFHLQIFFLGHRAAQHRQLALDPRSAIIDRSIYEDMHIFARALHEMGNVRERDYMSYLKLYNLVVESLPAPALLIYLRAPVEVLIDRISRRGRAMESGITPDYLRLLDRYYDEWLADFNVCPVLTIRSDNLD
ncbi:MAG TPA: deoxynucleoside kinase, partial [Anaerolineae bacterium]|nr:deoxynucleoside kinase [Anaerolineae bacterium]